MTCTLSLHSYAKDEESKSISKQSFSPIKQLKESILGNQLIDLYLMAEKSPEQTYTKLIQLSQRITLADNPLYQFGYYRILHKLEIARGQALASEKAIQDLFEYAKSKNVDWLVAEAQMWQATFYARQGELDHALALLNKALPIAIDTKYLRLQARVHNSTAVIYSQQSKLLLARKSYFKALDIFKLYPNDPYLSKVTSNISIIFAQLEQWNKALTYNQSAIDYFNKGADKSFRQLSSLHVNASFIARKGKMLNTLQVQREHLKKAQVYANKSGNIFAQTNVLSNLSDHWFESGDNELALSYAEQCLVNAKSANYKFSLAYCHLFKGQVKVAQKKNDSAEELLLISLGYFKDLKMQEGLRLVYKQLNTLYLQQEHYKNDYTNSELYYSNKLDNLFNKRQIKLNALEEEHAAAAKQQEIALLSAQNALQTSKLSQQSLREALALLLILICTIAIYFLVRRYWILKKHNGSLETSNHILYEQSHHDALTGLFNRRYFEEQMNKPLLEDNSQYVLAIIDIDFFKKVNDTYGHDVGDEVLCKLAKTLNDNIRQHDFVTRWGGEEFVITLAQTDQADIKTVLERLKNIVQNTQIQTSSGNLSITLSIGVSNEIKAKSLKNSWSLALESADKALYQAKNSGRNRIIYTVEHESYV
jgi:diguanylate cyclase (GGDEF)-like protein